MGGVVEELRSVPVHKDSHATEKKEPPECLSGVGYREHANDGYFICAG